MTLLATMTLTGAFITRAQAETTASGGFGYCDLTWKLEGGKLTISGSDGMDDFGRTNDSTPWANYREQVTLLVIEEGVTQNGCNSFKWCSNLHTVIIPKSVEAIGWGAFGGENDGESGGCTSLIDVYYAGSE